MGRGVAAAEVRRSRHSTVGVALALAALWVLVFQPLSHIALLRALLQTVGPGYTIICTVNGPRLVEEGNRDASPVGDFIPLKKSDRPLPDCCVGGAIAVSLPLVVALVFGLEGFVAVEAPPLGESRPLASLSAWWLPKPRGPPASIL